MPMKIIFRLNFHTVPGQSLWLKLATVSACSQVRIDQVLPLRWINDRQWQAELDVHCEGALRLEYSYQFRDGGNGVELDEWDGPRVADPADSPRTTCCSCRTPGARPARSITPMKPRPSARCCRPGDFSARRAAGCEPHLPTPHGGRARPAGAVPDRQRPGNRRLGLASCGATARGGRQCLAGERLRARRLADRIQIRPVRSQARLRGELWKTAKTACWKAVSIAGRQ
jgi:hypothetical protein